MKTSIYFEVAKYATTLFLGLVSMAGFFYANRYPGI